jgi:hypothetical protein
MVMDNAKKTRPWRNGSPKKPMESAAIQAATIPATEAVIGEALTPASKESFFVSSFLDCLGIVSITQFHAEMARLPRKTRKFICHGTE